MKKKELLNAVPRANNVIIRGALNNVTKGGIHIPESVQRENGEVKYFVVAFGNKVEELTVGDEVYLADMALALLNVEDADDNESFYYTPDTFIKFTY